VSRDRARLLLALALRLPELPHTEPDEETRAAFAALLEAVPAGGELAYRLDRPKHELLEYAVGKRGVVLHGTPDGTISEFEPRPQTRATGEPATAVFATPDPVWPLYFAILRRDVVRSLRNMPLYAAGRRFYYFSLSEPLEDAIGDAGFVYLLPAETFGPGWGKLEWESAAPVRPLCRLPVTPADFPFLDRVLRHRHGESTPRFGLRLAGDAFRGGRRLPLLRRKGRVSRAERSRSAVRRRAPRGPV
jgi:hypothetical protein